MFRQVVGGSHEQHQVKVWGSPCLGLELPEHGQLAECRFVPSEQCLKVELRLGRRREALRVGQRRHCNPAGGYLASINAVQVPQQPQTARSSEPRDALADASGA
jgi:hypothetical protein